jgi:hypothetical protein
MEDKDIKVIKDDGKLTVDDRITIKELEEKLDSMKADKEKKLTSAKEQLIGMLEVTVDKYRTATGTAEAVRVLRFVVGDQDVHITWANRLAWDMAIETDKVKEKAESLDYAEMDKLCDGFYEKEFKADDSYGGNIDCGTPGNSYYRLAFELMRIDLCRNISGAAEDMVEFIKRVDEEIESTEKKLAELKAKEVE